MDGPNRMGAASSMSNFPGHQGSWQKRPLTAVNRILPVLSNPTARISAGWNIFYTLADHKIYALLQSKGLSAKEKIPKSSPMLLQCNENRFSLSFSSVHAIPQPFHGNQPYRIGGFLLDFFPELSDMNHQSILIAIVILSPNRFR